MKLVLGLCVCSVIGQTRAFSPTTLPITSSRVPASISTNHPITNTPTEVCVRNSHHHGKGNRCVLSALNDEVDSEEPQRQQDRLLSLLGFIQNRDVGRLPCGLDAMEKEQELVAKVIEEVEQDVTHNLVAIRNGKIEPKDLFGDWTLLYTSSRTMIINKSLSGLGRSESDKAKLVSLVQKLEGNKFLSTVEFVEQFGTGEDGLQVSIPGEWSTKPQTNIFTGAPTTAIAIDPERVIYGPSNNNADDWSSLGPIKLLDLVYLSQDMMISRVNVNPEGVFVWQRI